MTVAVGDALPELVIDAVPVEKMKTMAALLHDSNPIHWDVAAVRQLGMGDRPINQGPSNMAYVINMLTAWTGDRSALRSINVRFLGNVFGGERVVAGGSVTSLEQLDEEKRAACEVWLARDDGTLAMSGTAVVAISGD